MPLCIQVSPPMADKHFPGLDRLIQHANQVSGRKPDAIDILARMIALVTDDGADPYLVLGVLVEGAARTLERHVPPERQAEATEELRNLLVERLAARGLL